MAPTKLPVSTLGKRLRPAVLLHGKARQLGAVLTPQCWLQTASSKCNPWFLCRLAVLLVPVVAQDPPTSPYANIYEELTCQYQTQTATLFGMIGGGVLALCMAVVSVLGGCVCCVTMTYSFGRALQVSILAFTLTW